MPGDSHPGHKHNRDPGPHLPERPVHLLVRGKYIPQRRAGVHGGRQHCRFLVHPAPLEDRLEEDGKPSTFCSYLERTLAIDTHGVQFMVANVFAILLTLWGMIGIWTTKFGWVMFILISS